MSSSIEEIKQNYKDLFEYSLDYIFITDLNGKILEINKTLLQDLEISASKIISKNLYEFLVNIEVVEEQDKKQQLKEFKTSREPLIYKLNKKNGSPIFIEISKIPITKNDQVVAFLGIGRSITRQINKDKNLYAISQYSKEIENIINHSPIVAFTWKNDKGWPVEFVSDNIIQFGYEPKEFLTGKLLYSDIIYPDDLERVSREFMHKEQKNYNEFTLECRIITKNSQMRWVNHHIWIKRNEKGEIKYYHGIILDITEKKIEEIKLRESEELFRNVFEILPYYSIIYRIVKDHITLIAYNKLADRYGRTDYKELLGKRRNYFSINEDDRHYFYDKMIHCIKTKKSIIEEDDFYNEYLKSRRDLVRIYNYVPPDLVLCLVDDITLRKTAEKKLKESEEKYRTIIENAKEGYYETNLRGDYTLVNNAYCKLVEYSREELIGQNYKKFITKEMSEKAFTAFNTVYNTGIEQANFEYEVITKSGKIKYNDTSIHLIYDTEGNKIGFRGFIRETTERKLAEEKLKESEERFRKLFKGSSNFTIAWQKVKDDFILIDYNEGADKISNGGIVERIGKTATQMYIKELNRPDLVENLTECFEKKKNYTKETKRYIDFVDTERDIKTKYTYVPPDLVLSNIEDITEKKKQEQRLKESEEKYRTIIEDAKEGYYETNLRGDYTLVNNAYCKLLEYSSEEIIGQNYRKFTKKDAIEKTFTAFNTVYNTGIEQTNFEYEIITKSGNIKYGDTSIHLIYDQEGNRIGFRGFLKDRTEKKNAEDKLKKSEKQFRKYFKGGPNFIVAWQKVKDDFILIDFNDAAIKISNGKIQDRLGQTAFQIFIDEINRPDLLENMNICFDRKRNYTKEVRRHVLFAGEERDLRIKYQYVPPDLVLAHNEDITELNKREQELKESEEKFRLISENSNDLICIVSTDYIIEYINENTYLKLLGYSNEDLIGESLTKILHPEELQKNLNFARKVREIGEAVQEARLKHKDGHWVWFDAFAKEFFDKYGNSKGLIVSRDITEKKKAELKLKESEEKYRTIIENAKEGYYETNLRGDYTLVNNAYCKLFEYSREELIGQNYKNFITKEMSEKTFIVFNTVYNTGIEQAAFEYEINTKSGKIKFYDTSIHLIYDPEGNKIGFRGFIRETTERKLAEEKLKVSEEKYRTIIENAKEGYYETNLRGDYTLVNNAYCKLAEYSHEELIGQNYKKFITKEMSEKAFTAFNTVYNTGIEQANFEYEIITKSGNIKYGESSILLIYDQEGNKIGFRGFLRDRTEKKIAEEKLKDSEEKYHNAYERENFYKDLFMHDMSNILQGMLSSLELCNIMLKNSNRYENIFEMLNNLRDQIQRGASLVKNVRKFSDIQDSEISLRTVIVKDSLEKAINVVKNSTLKKKINIQTENLNDKIQIQSDDFLLDIFENILFNAIKHNDNSIVEILIRLSEIQKNSKKFLKIEFIDNGYGIDDSRKLSIFKRGYKEDKSIVGIGLGLSLVYNILNRYSAKIWVENRVPEDYTKGSNFIIQFPLF